MVQLNNLYVIVQYVRLINTRRKNQLAFCNLLKIRLAHLNILPWILLHTFRWVHVATMLFLALYTAFRAIVALFHVILPCQHWIALTCFLSIGSVNTVCLLRSCPIVMHVLHLVSGKSWPNSCSAKYHCPQHTIHKLMASPNASTVRLSKCYVVIAVACNNNGAKCWHSVSSH